MAEFEDEDDLDPRASLSAMERKAVASLERLAKKWPRSLTLASMGGELVVIRTGDDRFLDPDPQARQDAVIEEISGIPNTGGDW